MTGGQTPSVVPLPTVAQRRSRITEARDYHPRGRTAADPATARPADPVRPALRLVNDGDADRPPRRRNPAARPPESGVDIEGGRGRAAGGRSVGRDATPQPRQAQPRQAQPRTAQPRQTQTRTAQTRTAQSRGSEPAAGQSRTVRARAANARTTAAHAAAARQAAPRRTSVEVPLPPRPGDQVRRLRFGTLLILALLLVIAGRVVEMQIVQAPAWAQTGLDKRLHTVPLPALRGDIVDRNGALLAGSAEARYVYVDPGLVVDAKAVATALVPVLGIPYSTLYPKIAPHLNVNNVSSQFEYLARELPVSVGQSVEALNLPGIYVARDESRVVPGHDLAANLIGFTGDGMVGLGGLEETYDSVLRGVDGQHVFERGQPDSAKLGQEIPGGYSQTTAARPGSTLQLTIDRDLQFEVQSILGQRMRQVKADMGAAVVLDVRTGEVLAQASYPFYDAANPFDSPVADRGDNATGWAMEPGSVHKGIVFAACLQQGVVNPQSTVLVQPTITKGDQTYTDTTYNSTPTRMTLPGILAVSSNVGTIELADKLGAQAAMAFFCTCTSLRRIAVGDGRPCPCSGSTGSVRACRRAASSS